MLYKVYTIIFKYNSEISFLDSFHYWIWLSSSHARFAADHLSSMSLDPMHGQRLFLFMQF